MVVLWVLAGCCAQQSVQGDVSDKVVAPNSSLSSDHLLDFSAPFSMEWYEGNGRDGYDSVRIDTLGNATLVYRSTVSPNAEAVPGHRSISIRLSGDDLRALRVQMSNAGIADLHASYSNKNIADGTQILARITVDEHAKAVCCNNAFPKAVRKTREYLHSRIINRFAADLRKSQADVPIEQTWPPFSCQ